MKQAKSRKVLSTILCIVIISVFSLSIAYAVLSETLTISGSGTINATSWNIGILDSITDVTATGSANYTPPIINGTTISYGASFTKPSDSISMVFTMLNTGDISGEITSIVTSTPECTSVTGNTADAKLVCDNLEITLTYLDGTALSVGDVINNYSYTCINGTTTGDSLTYIKLMVKLKDSMTSVPSSQVNITNLKHDIIYSQTEKICSLATCFTKGTKVAVENGYKNIEDIKVGEYVYSYNLKTKTKELNKVLRTFKYQKDEIYTLKINNQIINTTEDHPFYDIYNGWVLAKDLKFNNQLLSLKNKETKIHSINKHNYKNIYVYNIKVENNHNYLITTDEILVHNRPHDVPPLL